MAKTEKRIKNPKKIFIICSLAVVIVAMGATIIYLLNRKPSTSGLEYENNAVMGLMPGVDREALLAMLQENVDKSAIAFSINSNPTISGKKMDIYFENPEGNEKDLVLELFDNATGECIYQSKAIREGSFLSTIPIDQEYASGEYIFTAYITAYDIETHQTIGQAAAELNVVIS